MPAYIQGNLALDQKKPTQKVKIKETRKVVYRQKTMPVQEKMLYLFTIALCVLVAGVIVWRYAQIYQLNTNMYLMQKDIREIQAENSALKKEVEMLSSPENLKGRAVEYGFSKPKEDPVQVSPNSNKSSSAASSTQKAKDKTTP
ncbi:Cell division protein FtsL [compost metagenome]